MHHVLAFADSKRAALLRAALPAGVRLEAVACTAAFATRLADDPVPSVILLATGPDEGQTAALLDALQVKAAGLPRILWPVRDDLTQVAAALRAGGLASLIPPDPTAAAITTALNEALASSDRAARARIEVDRLDFACEVLGETIHALEHHVGLARKVIESLERLVDGMRGADSLEVLADLAVTGVRACLGGCGVRIALERPTRDVFVEACTSDEGAAVLVRVPLRAGERELGYLEVLGDEGVKMAEP